MPIYLTTPYTSPPFTPAALPDLGFWIDATTITVGDGNPVSQWNDLSPNAQHLTSSGASRPVWVDNVVNGLPVVAGSGKTMTNSSATGVGVVQPTAATIYTVGFVPATGNAVQIRLHEFPATIVVEAHYFGGIGDKIDYAFGATGTNTRPTWPGGYDNAYRAAEWYRDGASGEYNQITAGSPVFDNQAITSTGSVTPANINLIDIPNFTGNALGEVIIYARALSVPEREQVKTYLQNKWNL